MFILHYIGPITESNLNLQYPYGNHTIILKYQDITVLGIFGIKPLTTYMITVLPFTDGGIGLPSDPIIVTTEKEGRFYHNIILHMTELLKSYDPLF